MSEKRILCFEMPLDCRKCREDVFLSRCEICSPVKNKWCIREQAIEKMAKAFCSLYSECSVCAFRDNPKECKALLKRSDFYEQAEAALNALLENKE